MKKKTVSHGAGFSAKRREFLKGASIGAALTSFDSLFFRAHRAQAQEALPRFFVMFAVAGGMDDTLGLDPWQSSPNARDLYLGYGPNEILHTGGLRLGPAAHAMKDFAADLLVINGLVMHDTNVDHAANAQYILTGKGSGQPDLPLSLAQYNGGVRGVVANSSINSGHLEKFTFTAIADLQSLYYDRPDLTMACLFGLGILDNEYTRALTVACQSRDKTAALYEIFTAANNNPNLATMSRDEKMLLAAFASDSCYQAKWQITPERGEIDSHASHAEMHPVAQTSVWAQVARTLAGFRQVEYKSTGQSLYDLTTFMVVTDFTRTPALNGAAGKDHNPQSNSAVLIGKGIKGGRHLGKSTLISSQDSASGISALWGLPLNMRTGEVAGNLEEALHADFNFIFPENLVGTLLSPYIDKAKRKELGFDEAIFKLLPGVLR